MVDLEFDNVGFGRVDGSFNIGRGAFDPVSGADASADAHAGDNTVASCRDPGPGDDDSDQDENEDSDENQQEEDETINDNPTDQPTVGSPT